MNKTKFRIVPVYEVEMEVLSKLTGNWEHKWEYVRAQDSVEAKAKITWLYGQMVEFLNVEVDDGKTKKL